MDTRSLARPIMTLVASLATATASAATILEGVRIDSRTGKPDLQIQVTVDRGVARADVLRDDRLYISAIESGKRLTLIDHVAGNYVVRQTTPATPVELRSTARRQLALGAYCRIAEARISPTATQEICLVDATEVVGIGDVSGGAVGIGAFLSALAQHAEVDALFSRVVASVALDGASGFPLIVRLFEGGVATTELRLSRVTRGPAKYGFSIPSGFRELPDTRVETKQAAR